MLDPRPNRQLTSREAANLISIYLAGLSGMVHADDLWEALCSLAENGHGTHEAWSQNNQHCGITRRAFVVIPLLDVEPEEHKDV